MPTTPARAIHHLISFIILLAIIAIVATLGATASINAPDFYAQLQKPSWAPPAGVFGPVWSLLYLLMTIAAWLVVRERGWRGARLELGVYFLQLVLNTLWSWWFFAWRDGTTALLDIAAMWCAIVMNIWLFWKIRPLAGLLLIPYLLWVSFAAALTWSVVSRNPALL